MPEEGWLYRYFNRDWAALRFQPLAFLFLWLGTWHVLWTDNYPPIELSQVIGAWAYGGWIGLSLGSPVLLGAAYLAMRSNRYAKYVGLWLRLAADFGQAVAVGVFLAAWIVQRGAGENDYRLYLFFTAVSVLVFLVVMVVRDVWQLVVVERLATRLEAT